MPSPNTIKPWLEDFKAVLLASFSRSRASLYVIGWFAACAVFLALTLYHPTDVPLKTYIDAKGPYSFEVAVAVWVAVTLLVLRQMTILHQLLLRNGAAIWSESDKIHCMNIYRDIFFTTISRSDIGSVTTGSMGRFRPHGIVIKLNNGRQKNIPTWILSEPANVIAERLRASLFAR